MPKVEDYKVNVTAELNNTGAGGDITLDLPDDATGFVYVTVNGVETVYPVNGTTTVPVDGLVVGDNNISVVYSGDDKYVNVTKEFNVTVPKVERYDVEITGNMSGGKGIIEVILPTDATGSVIVEINGEYYVSDVINGTAKVNIPELAPGTYEVITSYTGDSKYSNKTIKSNITFETSIELLVNDLITYYHGGDKLIAYLIDNTGRGIVNQTIVFKINNMAYYRITDENGMASLNINLNNGYYTVDVIYENITKSVSVTVLSTIIGEDLIKFYHNDTQYYAYFCDSKGNALVNAAVTFNINGVMYTRTTNESGIAKLNINLNAGKYILTAINPSNGEMCSNNVTVITTVQAEDVTKMYKNGTQYKAQFFNTDGSVLINMEVIFNINGVFYTKITDENGYAYLNINLLPGDYIITAYNSKTGELVSNNIEVKPILVGNDLTKVYGSEDQYEVMAYDNQGKPLVGANIEININGVLYYKITDGSGIARLDINLLPGEYILTANYNDFATSNKINVLETI